MAKPGKPKKAGFTFEQHAEMGVRLTRAQTELTGMLADIDRHYAVKFARPMRRAIERIQAMRCILDSKVFDEWPAQASPKTYYGYCQPRK